MEKFCKMKGWNSRTSSQNGTYRQHLMVTTRSHTAVDSAIYSIQWVRGLAGIPSPTDSPITHWLRQTAKKLCRTRVVNKKEPISADVIKRLFNLSNVESLLDLINFSIFLLAYTLFFRIEEALHIKYGDMTFPWQLRSHQCWQERNRLAQKG